MARAITLRQDGTFDTPCDPIIPFAKGDGIGPEIWACARQVFDRAVAKAQGGRSVDWLEIAAGSNALEQYGDTLPKDSLDKIKTYHVAIKGPITTPVGRGIRSVNVALRQALDLYACVRPIQYFSPAPSPVKQPELVDMVVFRENTEDVYCGLEWPVGSPEACAIIALVSKLAKREIRQDSGIGIKPMSKFASQRLVRMAIEYALKHNYPSVTLVHKGNIMKFTEGGFRAWGYELARDEFGDITLTEQELYEQHGGVLPSDKKLIIKDRICDAMFQQVLLNPKDYSVLALPNLNGDYMSDALAAQVGGLGLAPGANIGQGVAVFEATHGSSPKDAGQNKVNPSAMILSGAMLFAYIGWEDVAESLRGAIAKAIATRHVTFDLAQQMPDSTQVSLTDFTKIILDNL
ncbi:MAG: NADP-dependent isocitrate dehydrogenase [Desulfovibrionaceae bacterium]|nr:NADP-dependent isocitrate dehydrogenase [Desulfovibrionaceae bacterium]